MKLLQPKVIYLLSFLIFSVSVFSAIPDFRMAGFATLNGSTTGGEGGAIVTPQTFAELKQYIENRSTPYVIRITKEFNTDIQTWVDAYGTVVACDTPGARETTFGAILKIGSNKTVIGVGESAFFNRIGLVIQCQSNIIIRNIRFTMKDVPATREDEYKILAPDGITTIGDPDCIGIQADAESVAEEKRISQHIWIDHCEFYNENIDNKDRYDGLLDSKNNVQYLTVSWCYFHDHSKALLSGKGSSDNYNRTITFHHNYFSNIFGSRLPLLRFGQHHYFNNYMEGCEGDGVNLRINTNAYIENNYFKDSKKPLFGKLSEKGQAILVDNIFENCSRLPNGVVNIDGAKYDLLSSDEEFVRECNFTPSELYSYVDILTATVDVPNIVKLYSGIGKIIDFSTNTGHTSAKKAKVWICEDGVVVDGIYKNVTVYSSVGSIVCISNHNNDGDSHLISLQKNGYYLLKLESDKGNETVKVVF
ncbi:MAG: T9SS type A sorting domain-containing protein [Marinilabiliaceae bacterium]|nr:T9SS type A sorting domain-containing protein [Marinilabiliaceae bacterium]